jgi:hypothetical protein
VVPVRSDMTVTAWPSAAVFSRRMRELLLASFGIRIVKLKLVEFSRCMILGSVFDGAAIIRRRRDSPVHDLAGVSSPCLCAGVQPSR